MALGPFGLTADRVTVVDFATPLFSDATRLIGTRGRPEVDPWGFLLPFTPSLWTATLSSLGIVVAAALILLTTRQKTQTSRPAHKMVQLWQAVFSLVFVYSGVLFQQGNTTVSPAQTVIMVISTSVSFLATDTGHFLLELHVDIITVYRLNTRCPVIQTMC